MTIDASRAAEIAALERLLDKTKGLYLDLQSAIEELRISNLLIAAGSDDERLDILDELPRAPYVLEKIAAIRSRLADCEDAPAPEVDGDQQMIEVRQARLSILRQRAAAGAKDAIEALYYEFGEGI